MAFTLDPLLDNPDGYQIAYIKKLLNSVKNSDDALCRNRIQLSKSTDQLKYGSELIKINKNMTTICEIAIFYIHSKIANTGASKDCLTEIKLDSLFFVPKQLPESEADMLNDTNEDVTRDLETTLGILKDLDRENEGEKSSHSQASRKRKLKQRKAADESNEDDDDENEEDENCSVNSNSLSLSATKGKSSRESASKSKKTTPNSSTSSLSSSLKSPPTKLTTKKQKKLEMSPLAKKKKIEVPSRETSRESSPVIKVLTPRPEEEKGVSHSEIIITKIAPNKALDSVREDGDDEKEVEKSKTKNAKKKNNTRKKATKEVSNSDEEDIGKSDDDGNKKSNRKVKQQKKNQDDRNDLETDESGKASNNESTGIYTLRLR